jgi:SpoVK/Ycf46/Vps4 family AAA+-type ATPase
METKQKKQMDLLTAIEQIVEKAKDSKLNPEFYRKASRYIKYVSDKLDLTKEQSVMLALFMNRSDDNRIRISELSEDVACSTIHILRYMNDIDVLEKREFVRCCRDFHGYRKSISYRVPFDVIEAMKRDEKYVPKKSTGLTCQELFGEFEELFDLRNENEITYEALTQKVNSLFEDNKQLQFVKLVNGIFPANENDEKILLILFCHLCVNNGDDNIGFHDLDFLFDDKREWNRHKRWISSGDHILFAVDVIEYNNDNGMVDRESFRVTQKFKDEALSEVVLKTKNRDKNSSDYIHSDKIVEKQLFYGQSIQNQIEELRGLLDEGHYQEITSRMKKAGFRCGFTCLFYGAPGTGKTETVLQLARQTGRDILQVDVSKIKSCWVGESEKNIKSLFDAYKDKVKKSEKAPILLFNEADAIINKRQEGAERAVDKMENSIQNIILQEMENLDGIMIATTNLTQNMDKAFERRFLYKIKFEKPTLEARMHIWHEMIPALSEDDTKTLAEKYEFSGGQIENIARHNAINGILYGDKGNSLEALMSYCDNERLETKQTRKIGF